MSDETDKKDGRNPPPSKRPDMTKNEDGTTAMQAAFVVAFTSTDGAVGNASEAARRAGYSQQTAGEIGRQLLAKPHIRAAIDRALRDKVSGELVTAAWETLRLCLSAPKEADRINAAKAILDRGGHSVATADRRTGEADKASRPDSEKTLAELDAEIAQRLAEREARERALQVVSAPLRPDHPSELSGISGQSVIDQ